MNFDWSADFYRKVSGFVFRRFRSDFDLAHDAATQCWIEAIEKPDGYFPSWEKLIGWGLFIGKKRALDLLRKGKRSRLAPLPEQLTAPPGMGSEWQQLREMVVVCLHDLTPSERQLLEGYYWGGLSDRELAAQGGAEAGQSDGPRQTVRRRRKHAEKKLSNSLTAALATRRRRRREAGMAPGQPGLPAG
jgi:RNA polymerase sigma factor (sigma-70 family)